MWVQTYLYLSLSNNDKMFQITQTCSVYIIGTCKVDSNEAMLVVRLNIVKDLLQLSIAMCLRKR